MPGRPNVLNDRLEGRPVNLFKMLRVDERNTTAVHPESDRQEFLRVGARKGRVKHVGRQRLAGGEDLFWSLPQIGHQAHVAAELVGQDVHRRLEDSAQGAGHSGLGAHQFRLPAEALKVAEHGEAALDQCNLVAVGALLARSDNLARDPRQPDLVEIAGRIVDQVVVFLRPHPGLVFRRFEVLEPAIRPRGDSRNPVVLQPERLNQAGPDIDHVAHQGIDVEEPGGLADSGECLLEIVGHLHHVVTGQLAAKFGKERPDRHTIGLLVAHRRHEAMQALAIQPVEVLGRTAFRSDGGTAHDLLLRVDWTLQRGRSRREASYPRRA